MVCNWKQTMLKGGFSKELKRTQKELEEKKKQLDEALLAIGKRDLMLEIVKKKLNLKDDAFTS